MLSLRRHSSRAAVELARQVALLAQHPRLPILIEGESGTGKTLLSRAIHDLSPRRDGCFVKTDLAAVQTELAASQLFGHFPGSFTGAAHERVGDFPRSNKGTLFLDEIGKCPLPVQQQLLGSIEYGFVRPLGSEREFPVDVRVIVATNEPLTKLVADGRFLPDLQARLLAGWMRVPPLRERRDDLPDLLAEMLLAAARARGRTNWPRVSDEFLEACLSYDWPMNLRELASVAERASLEAGGSPWLRRSHVPRHFPFAQAMRRRYRRPTTEEVVRTYRRNGEDPLQTARELGCDRSTVYRHLKKGQPSDPAEARDA